MGQYADDAVSYFMNRLIKKPNARKRSRNIRCKYCGATNLRWINPAGGQGSWMLVASDGKTPHSC